MTMQWWHLLIITSSGVLGTLVAVFLGGMLVYKTKTVTMPTPFFQKAQKRSGKPESYMSDLNGDTDIVDESLSPAASRLRAQKISLDNVKELWKGAGR